jgi:hypothetical protein
MTKQVRVNVRTLVNSAAIRRERRDGRDVIVVPSATLPDNIVMNGSGGRIRYRAEEIEKGYRSLENTLAPLGHPMVNGAFVSASHPLGLARGYIGAHNENVRRENGRVWTDKVIDVAIANQLDGGKSVLEAIDKGDPIHTSVGLLAMLAKTPAADEEAEYDATDMVFDHDAILLGEDGAATPDQGVGIFVNTEGDKIDVINCSLTDDIDRDIGWSIESMLRGYERKKQISLIERIKKYITDIVQGDPTPEITEGAALNASEDAMDKAQFDELSGKVAALSDTVAGIPDTISTAVANALKPFTDAQEARDKADKEKAESDRLELVNKVVEAKLLDADVAKDATAPVLNALLEKAKAEQPGTAFRVNGAFKQDGDKPTYKLPEGD